VFSYKALLVMKNLVTRNASTVAGFTGGAVVCSPATLLPGITLLLTIGSLPLPTPGSHTG